MIRKPEVKVKLWVGGKFTILNKARSGVQESTVEKLDVPCLRGGRYDELQNTRGRISDPIHFGRGAILGNVSNQCVDQVCTSRIQRGARRGHCPPKLLEYFFYLIKKFLYLWKFCPLTPLLQTIET